MLSDPIVALATPAGRAALALIRISGRGAYDIAARCLDPFRPVPARSVFRTRIVHPTTGATIDHALAVCFAAPHSYTGEDAVELSTHGGVLVPAETVAALAAAGARLALPGEFTRRAVLNGKMDLLQAEATGDLIDAAAPAQRRQALRQLDRGLSDRLAALRGEILELEALIAYDIDFPEEDEGPVPPERVARAWRAARDRVALLVRTAPEGERLREGALLVIAGPPNAGKSSLFNALVGVERAIVTDIPGTTRDAIEAHAVIEGFPFRLVDTAGLRPSVDHIERLGIEVSRRYLGAADLVLFCEEATEAGAPGGPERDRFLAACRAPVLRVRTKADVAGSAGVSADAVATSVRSGQGLAELRRRLAEAAFGALLELADAEPVVTRARHRAALNHALEELDAFGDARDAGVDAVATATHLRAAVTALDDLIGAVTPDDVLERVFAAFCVGK